MSKELPLIEITDITLEQRQILDKIWRFKTQAQYHRWFDKLDPLEQCQALFLTDMLKLAIQQQEILNLCEYKKHDS